MVDRGREEERGERERDRIPFPLPSSSSASSFIRQHLLKEGVGGGREGGRGNRRRRGRGWNQTKKHSTSVSV